MKFEPNNNFLEEATTEELEQGLLLTEDDCLKGEIEAQLDYRKEKES